MPSPRDGVPAGLRTVVRGCSLLWLPSFHFSSSISSLVPEYGDVDGVAVELSEEYAHEVIRLLDDHCPNGGDPLPGVLGLAKVPSRSGAPLDVLPLVQSDSIVEALRTHRHKGAYGIDLDGTAPARPPRAAEQALLPDPVHHVRDLASLDRYVRRYVLPYATSFRKSAGADFQARNLHMAGRLLEISEQHSGERLLVVIGLSHFPDLLTLIRHSDLRPIKAASMPNEKSQLTRVTLSPGLALPFMDRSPCVVRNFEERRGEFYGGIAGSTRIDPSAIARRAVERSIEAARDPERRRLGASLLEVGPELAFRQLLVHLSALRNEEVPFLPTLMAAAESTAPVLTPHLLDELMDYPWLLEDAPYPVLEMIRDPARNGTWVRLGASDYLLSGETEFSDWGSRRMEDLRSTRADASSGRLRTWPPEDALLGALALRIADIASNPPEDDAGTESLRLFEAGSFLDGLDIRTTLRRLAAGDECTVWVEERPSFETKGTGMEWPFPLLLLHREAGEGEFHSWSAPLSEAAGAGLGGKSLHGVIGHGVERHTREGISECRFSGVLYFVPPHFGAPEAASESLESPWDCWVAKGNSGRVPLGSPFIEDLFPRLQEGNPHLGLLRLALAYSPSGRVFVAHADSLRTDELKSVAVESGREVSFVPFNVLPEKIITRLEVIHLVPWEYDPRSSQYLGGRPCSWGAQAMAEDVTAFQYLDLKQLKTP